MSAASLPGPTHAMVDRLNDLTRTGDEIQGRLYRAAERVDQLDASLPPAKRSQLVPALRELWSVADELAVHASRLRSALDV